MLLIKLSSLYYAWSWQSWTFFLSKSVSKCTIKSVFLKLSPLLPQMYKGDPRPRTPPCVMASSAMGLKLGVFEFLPIKRKTNVSTILPRCAVCDAFLSLRSHRNRCRWHTHLTNHSYCGPPLAMLEGPLRFSLSRCLYVCTDGWMDVWRLLVNQKGKP